MQTQSRTLPRSDYNWAPSIWGHQGPAYLDKYTVVVADDPASRVTALESGDANAIEDTPEIGLQLGPVDLGPPGSRLPRQVHRRRGRRPRLTGDCARVRRCKRNRGHSRDRTTTGPRRSGATRVPPTSTSTPSSWPTTPPHG